MWFQKGIREVSPSSSTSDCSNCETMPPGSSWYHDLEWYCTHHYPTLPRWWFFRVYDKKCMLILEFQAVSWYGEVLCHRTQLEKAESSGVGSGISIPLVKPFFERCVTNTRIIRFSSWYITKPWYRPDSLVPIHWQSFSHTSLFLECLLGSFGIM